MRMEVTFIYKKVATPTAYEHEKKLHLQNYPWKLEEFQN
jgi:hypothetical protein